MANNSRNSKAWETRPPHVIAHYGLPNETIHYANQLATRLRRYAKDIAGHGDATGLLKLAKACDEYLLHDLPELLDTLKPAYNSHFGFPGAEHVAKMRAALSLKTSQEASEILSGSMTTPQACEAFQGAK